MIGSGRTIAKNASVMMISQVINWGLGLVLTIVLPRYLGPAAVGKFHLALSIWAMLGLFVTFGLDMLLTKEVARTPERIGVLFGTTIGLRSLFFIISLGVLSVYISFAGYPHDTVIVLYIIGLTTFVGQLSSVLQAILYGLERMEYISLGSIANKLLVTALIVIFLLLGYGLFVAAAIGIVGAFLNFLILLWALRKFAVVRFDFSWSMAKWLLRAGMPYLAATMFLVFYIQMDVVIISLIVDEQTVGWYSAADHLFGTFMFIPGILMASVFPALSRAHQGSADASSRFVSRSFRWLLMLGVPIGIGLIVVSDSLVVLLYGQEFINSGAVLAVDGVVLIFMYLTTLMGWSLVAMDRQKEWAIIMAVATAATIFLDLLLVPWCARTFGNGAIGGALAYVVTEAGMVLTGLYLLPRGTFRKSDTFFALRVVLAGALMGLFAWLWRDSFIFAVTAGVVSYVLLLLILRVMPQEEITMMRWLLQSTLRRVRLRTSGSHAGGS